jgi:hypothetical protein
LDSHNALYFSDLQGLTNITNSMSTDGGATWTTNCAGAPNAPDDRMWFAGTGSSAGGDLTLYQDYDAVDSALPTAGNQLVETVSHDGTTFTPVVNGAALGGTCTGLAVNCVTDNEGISGNQVVDPATGNVYIAHTTSDSAGVQVSEGKITPGTPTTATWSESPNLDASLCPDASCADAAGNPEELAGENFASIARDNAGYLYVTFTAGPLDHASSNDPNFGGLTAPEQIYVVHSLQPAGADPTTLTWSAPQKISGAGISAGTNTFPWITAGSDGRVAVAWYHADETSESGTCASGSGTCTLYGAANLTKGEWSVQLGESLNAHDGSPAYTTSPVTETYVKHGQICTNGLGCATGGDRSLGDFLQVSPAENGAAVVSYVFDTSADSSAGEDAGPEAISRQVSGPSLFAADGDVSQGSGPGQTMGSVTDPTGDGDYSANGTRTAASSNLDLTGASLANGAGQTIVATIKVASLKSLAVSPSLGGTDASWLIRWTEVTPGATGNGHIFYAGMDADAGTPAFFAGDTAGLPANNPAEHTKYMTYPQTHVLPASAASYDASTGTITLRVPRTDVGNPPNGTVLFSATAFSATAVGPQSAATLFNLIDATSPFELVVGQPGTVGTSPTSPGRGTAAPITTGAKQRCASPTGQLAARRLGPFTLGMTRTRARKLRPKFSVRRKLYMDFYCQVSSDGVRAFYPSPQLLRRLPAHKRGAYRNRVIVLLTAGHRYKLHGVVAGMKLASARKRLHPGRAYHVGKNFWYVTANGGSDGLLKVRRGVVQEVGIASKTFARTVADRKRFLRLLL